MQYDAIVTKEGRRLLVEFPDCVGCQTFADNADALPSRAAEALEGWLEANLVDGRVPPRPKAHARAPRGATLLRVLVSPKLSVALQVRWARVSRELSQTALAKIVGVSQQQIAKLEDPDANPTVDTVARVAKALGLPLSITFGEQQPHS